jgi:hypothetical protein
MAAAFLRRLELPQPVYASREPGKLATNKEIEPVPQNSPLRRWGWMALLGFC